MINDWSLQDSEDTKQLPKHKYVEDYLLDIYQLEIKEMMEKEEHNGEEYQT